MNPGIASPKKIRKKRSERTEEMRQRILEESVKLFLEQGYERTTTRQILQRVGILNGSLYNIYKSKEDIFSDIIMISLREVAEQMPIADGDRNSWIDRLSYILCAEIYYATNSPRIAELLSILSSNWAIRDRLYDAILRWPDETARMDRSSLVMRLDACTGVASILVQRQANEPGTLDMREAMSITVKMADSLFCRDPRDTDAAVDGVIASVSGRPISVCGIPVL